MAAAPKGTLFAEPRDKPTSPSGAFQPGCYRNFYLTGTTTFANVYADGGLSTPLPQPVIAASDGRFPQIYMDPNTTYRVQLYSAANVIQDDTDPYLPPGQISTFTGPITVQPTTDVHAITVIPFAPNDAGLVVNATNSTYRSYIEFWQQNLPKLYIGVNSGASDLISGSSAQSAIIRAATAELDLSINNGSSICAQFIQAGAGSSTFQFNVESKTTGALVDVTPDTDTPFVTVNGITGIGLVQIKFYKIGNICQVVLPAITGTSSATSFSLSGLPSSLIPSSVFANSISAVPAQTCTDNGTLQNGVSANLVASTTGLPPHLISSIVFNLGGSATGWTAGGTKGFPNAGVTLTFYVAN